MAELSFTLKDLNEVERICDELDPETHELTAFHIRRVRDLGNRLDLVQYIRRYIKGELLVGIAARAMGDALMRTGVAEEGAVNGWIGEDWCERYRPGHLGGDFLRYSHLTLNLGRVGNEQMTAFSIIGRWWGTEDFEPIRAVYDLLDLAHRSMFEEEEVSV